jgi:hypothetical protein
MSIYVTISSWGLVYEAYLQQQLWDQHEVAMEVQTHRIFGMMSVSSLSHILQRKISCFVISPPQSDDRRIVKDE